MIVAKTILTAPRRLPCPTCAATVYRASSLRRVGSRILLTLLLSLAYLILLSSDLGREISFSKVLFGPSGRKAFLFEPSGRKEVRGRSSTCWLSWSKAGVVQLKSKSEQLCKLYRRCFPLTNKVIFLQIKCRSNSSRQTILSDYRSVAVVILSPHKRITPV